MFRNTLATHLMKAMIMSSGIIECILLLCLPGLVAFERDSLYPVEPVFDDSDTNYTVIAGSTAVLHCSVENKGKLKVIWLNPRKTLISTDDIRHIDDPRMSVERPQIQDWFLHIRETRQNDTGEYMCQINTRPVKIKRIHLYILVPPEIVTEWSSDDHIQVREGVTIEFVCNATGVPSPEVRWLRPSQGFFNNYIDEYATSSMIGEILILHNISRYCDGTYVCAADNGVQPRAEKEFKVTVLFSPEVTLLNSRIGQVIGKETMLECKVSASPHASIVWKKNGTEIPTSLYKFWTEIYDDDDNHQKTLTLTVIDIQKEDFGYYTCEASNSLGFDSETMLLYEYVAVSSKHEDENRIVEPPPATKQTTVPIQLDKNTKSAPFSNRNNDQKAQEENSYSSYGSSGVLPQFNILMAFSCVTLSIQLISDVCKIVTTLR
ncbi:hypothetical protein CHS0354_014369 [Potamilus streckersoni]|uniref:Ig-like domain-containing protein n=1 Tax=Potamilus streckersoni TaxID=2493646 RepID=A0AAE0VYE7_9BIVA|nr:hypothetical protein CHS0354_014369 [Potamilus streckersoni]